MTEDRTVINNHVIVLFDGVCNLCNSAINFMIDHDSDKIFKFAPLQSDIGKSYINKLNINTLSIDTIIVVTKDTFYTKYEAIIYIGSMLTNPYRFFSKIGSIIPFYIGDICYDMVARSRYKIFGSKDTCRVPTPDIMDRFLV
ncbi:MAG: DCC1-like thiol-disulfide oxidoreductase family protein [Cytophagales bacterium]|nr:DCC1-like thiol-disulfide oxidoreductase family protein [Cytophagales bacterium]